VSDWRALSVRASCSMPHHHQYHDAAGRLIHTLQELGFPMPAIEEEIDTPSEQKWRDTIASILREFFDPDEEKSAAPGNDSGSTSSA
jgi:hypothetical protein